MNTYKDLEVWKLSYQLTLTIYKLTHAFPKEELYGLTSQLRRSAASIGANITEGSTRQTRKEFIQFLYTARGSLSETEYHLLLAKDLKYLEPRQLDELTIKYQLLGKKLNALITSLKKTL